LVPLHLLRWRELLFLQMPRCIIITVVIIIAITDASIFLAVEEEARTLCSGPFFVSAE